MSSPLVNKLCRDVRLASHHKPAIPHINAECVPSFAIISAAVKPVILKQPTSILYGGISLCSHIGEVRFGSQF